MFAKHVLAMHEQYGLIGLSVIGDAGPIMSHDVDAEPGQLQWAEYAIGGSNAVQSTAGGLNEVVGMMCDAASCG